MNICIILLILAFSWLPAGTALSAGLPTSACHCFKDRLYDPQQKFAADNYLLTTTFNSLIAANFSVSKRKIIMMKMNDHVDGDDLLIGLYVTRATHTETSLLLALRTNGSNWQQIMDIPGVAHHVKKDPLLSAIRQGLAEKDTATKITDILLRETFATNDKEIQSLRTKKFSDKEITVLYALARQQQKPLQELIDLNRQGKSWSEIAAGYSLTPADCGKLLLDKGKNHTGMIDPPNLEK